MRSAKPAAHPVSAQVDALQAPVPLAGAQARPHPPQWVALTRVSASQPLSRRPSQSAKPAVQVMAQVPWAQAGTALAAPRHMVLQNPQCATEVRRSASQPLRALPSQSPKFVAQRPTAQRPSTHVDSALARAQRLPQAPQAVAVVRVSVSQPLAGSPSQSSKPALQV